MVKFSLPFRYQHLLVEDEYDLIINNPELHTLLLPNEDYENIVYWTAFYSKDTPTIRAWGSYPNDDSEEKGYCVDFILKPNESGNDFDESWIRDISKVFPSVDYEPYKKTRYQNVPPWISFSSAATNVENLQFAKTIEQAKFARYQYVLLNNEELKKWL